MKKILIVFLFGCMLISVFTSCSKQEDHIIADSTINEEIVVENDMEVIPEGMARSYLTGEWIDEEVAIKRPIAVMLGNTKEALPQHGISEAQVIYESPVEGGLTRILAVIHDYENLEKVMSVRSCRHYFVHWALEYEAIYTHYGQSYLARDILNQDYVNNLNGMDSSVDSVVYARDNSRRSPHNAYTTGEKLVAGIEMKEYETTLSDNYEGHFLFNTDTENEIQLENGQEAFLIKPGYSVNKPWFEYNTKDGLYYRYQYGTDHIDGNNNEPLTCKNIILQVCNWKVMDQEHGYLDVDTMSGGHGYFITNGKVMPVVWEKESISSPTKFYYENGNEIVLNQGKTWVCIVQDTYEDRVSFVKE